MYYNGKNKYLKALYGRPSVIVNITANEKSQVSIKSNSNIFKNYLISKN
jgi:hypothetical protein